MRTAHIQRDTRETQISLDLCLDGTGKADIRTGCGFLDHMLELFARHGDFDLAVNCQGDTQVDDHHSVEDIGICLGIAFREALGDKRGIARYGSFLLPMDEALILCAVDLSGRSCLCDELDIPTEKIGTFDTELVEEFLLGIVRNCPMSLHLRQLAGKNAHHIVEGAFKGLGRALKQAVALDGSGEIPSTKGVLA